MNFDTINNKIDEFFSELKAEELVIAFEELGYIFTDIEDSEPDLIKRHGAT